ncbi:TIGR00282 family metallophosphoesterase [Halocella sp. SP3-1]|uniref:TIGR00282 family metallophosphoesterase n=1 Tax=Halocella sp. SP3-1 TaxID=2382161 RepID=UPI000F754B4D|nr:TIGR00282 family metallophosphoesterase [Halocella sp. SP3-1]AZO95471.1 TIGR00282 family metallophosphoesterase [Halocella sp. SP3-1]
MRIFFIGDIVGRIGRKAVKEILPDLQKKHGFDFVIANGENAAGGFGLTKLVAQELYSYGINCLTMGNHTWDNKDILNIIDEYAIVRPLNYNLGSPGSGWRVFAINNKKLAVVNFIGQVFMDNNSPFDKYEQEIANIKKESDLIVIDFHAEATGEKLAFAHYVTADVSCVVGTHTHIQTADEKIIEQQTAYITDLGMTGAVDSILGMSKTSVIERFRYQIPQRFKVARGLYQLEGLLVDINDTTGKAESVLRIHQTSLK